MPGRVTFSYIIFIKVIAMAKGKKKQRLPITENEIADGLLEKLNTPDPANPPAAETPPPGEMVELEVLPGLFVEVVADDRFNASITPTDWPSIFAAPPLVGDLVISLDRSTVLEVSRRGHSVGPLGPFLIAYVRPVQG